jgi:hypothetical protein
MIVVKLRALFFFALLIAIALIVIGRLRTPEGTDLYALRKQTPEPSASSAPSASFARGASSE